MIIFAVLVSAVVGQWVLLKEGVSPERSTGPQAQPEIVPLAPMWFDSDSLYYYGEYMWKYEIDEKRWFWQPDSPTVPVRSSAATWTIQDRFYMYGGMSTSLGTILDDFWYYDPASRLFSALPTGPGKCAGMASWVHETSNKIYAWGGFCDNATVRTLRYYDVNARGWTEQEPPSDNGPPPGKNAAAALVGDNTVYVYTDDKLWQLDLQQMNWSLASVTGNASPPGPMRSYHTMWTNAEGDGFYLFGGKSGSKIYADTWLFRKGEWSLIDSNDGPPEKWGLSSASSHGNVYMVLDGSTWKYGKITVKNIFQLIDWKLDSATFSSTIAAIMSSLVFFGLIVLAMMVCIRYCIRKRRANRFSDRILRQTDPGDVDL